VKIASIGGGPAGLYFAILMRKADPEGEITVFERNRVDDTFGFGVVFSDATMGNLEEADEPTYRRICESFHHWDDIEIHYQDRLLRSGGHGFAGVSRKHLLEILSDRCAELGVDLRFETEVTDFDAFEDYDLVLAADGVNSAVRTQNEERFETDIDWRPNRFIWLGTTRPFPAFTFYFKRNEHGLFRVHAYQYEEGCSTFIVETTSEALEATGLGTLAEDDAVAYFEELFADELQGHPLLKNRSHWRSFPTIKNGSWHDGKTVLMGDAVHTAHFSIGSGTKLAMEDAIELVRALRENDGVEAALTDYEATHRPYVESLQRAAQVSLQWFEDTERYMADEPEQFGFSLLTRSLRMTHAELALRDPEYVAGVDRWFADRAFAAAGVERAPGEKVPPPTFTPLRLRELVLPNRVVVSPMCMYSAVDGTVNDWHLVHLGGRAVGGAGLVMTEATNVGREGRITHGCAGMYEPAHVHAWRRITDFVHTHTASKIGIQLGHAGRKGATELPWVRGGAPLAEDDWPLVAPSPIPWSEGSQTPRAMDEEDMERVVADYARAAEMAHEAGFDLLEVHMAHGYLLATFLSPLTNRRTDEYGGSLAGRMRFPLRVLDAVRAAWPAEKPISVRISAVDWHPEGLQAEDAVLVARHLKEHGADVVDVSAGQTVPDQRPVYGRQFQTPFSDRIRHEADVPTIAVGNISSFMDVDTILAAGRADLVAMARPHLADPYWTHNAARRSEWPLDWPAPYSVLAGYTPRFE
jgi:anthraniloyl-CoA monooxygenase